jgi:hypothetical protein
MNPDHKQIIDYIVASIDLNYLLAESRINNYRIRLETIGDNSKQKKSIPYEYDIAKDIISKFISKNLNKVIQIHQFSKDYHYPLDRKIIIHVPKGIDFQKYSKQSLFFIN